MGNRRMTHSPPDSLHGGGISAVSIVVRTPVLAESRSVRQGDTCSELLELGKDILTGQKARCESNTADHDRFSCLCCKNCKGSHMNIEDAHRKMI